MKVVFCDKDVCEYKDKTSRHCKIISCMGNVIWRAQLLSNDPTQPVTVKCPRGEEFKINLNTKKGE